MKKLRYYFFAVFVCCFMFLISSTVGAVSAASLKFDKTTVSVNTGDTFQIQVQLDPGSEQVTSTDIYVKYDSALLSAQTVTPGTYFPTVLSDLTTGKVYVAGIVEKPTDYKTGTGTVATITFKALTNGSPTLTFDCQTGNNNTSTSKIVKNDINATNVITCSENGSASVTVGNGVSSGTSSTTSTSSVTSLPTTDSSVDSDTVSDDTIATTSATTLPESGVMDNMAKVAIPGILLLFVGGLLKLKGI